MDLPERTSVERSYSRQRSDKSRAPSGTSPSRSQPSTPLITPRLTIARQRNSRSHYLNFVQQGYRDSLSVADGQVAPAEGYMPEGSDPVPLEAATPATQAIESRNAAAKGLR